MEHQKDEEVTFIAQRRCTLRGRSYREGDQVTVTLTRDWDEEEGLGAGGPWGWGGYTSQLLRSLGNWV